MTATTMPVREFQYNSPNKLRHVVNSGEPLHVQLRRKPYVTVVPRDWFERAAAALAREEAREGVTAN